MRLMPPSCVQAGSATNLLFAMLDEDGSNRISKSEFMHLVTVLKVQWEEEEVTTYLEHHWPRLYQSRVFQAIRSVVLSDAFQWGALTHALTLSTLRPILPCTAARARRDGYPAQLEDVLCKSLYG